MLHGIPVALAVMEFGFMGGSMGSVVGEKLTRLIEYATQEGLTLMVVCTSGGARMQVRERGGGGGGGRGGGRKGSMHSEHARM